jgi:penicillin-binding protein-related factor A (putative recombinase)
MKKLKISEKSLQKAILDYLTLKKVFHYRNNSGAFRTEKGGFYRFGAVGSPDIVCVIKGQYVALEIKGTYGKQSLGQKKFQEDLEKAGGSYFLIRCFEDFVEMLGRYDMTILAPA